MFRLGTFLAACGLTAQVVSDGPQLVWGAQFYIDPLNVGHTDRLCQPDHSHFFTTLYAH